MADEQVNEQTTTPEPQAPAETPAAPTVSDETKQRWQEFDKTALGPGEDPPVSPEEPDEEEDVPAREPVPAAPGDSTDKPPVEVWDPKLIEAAAKHGWSESEAKRIFRSPTDLVQAIGMLAQARQQMPAQQPEPPKPPQQPVQQQAPAQEAPPLPPDLTYKLEFDPDISDPEVGKHLAGMNQHYARAVAAIRNEHAAQVAAMQNQLAEVYGAIQQQQAADQERRFDEVLNGLGEEYAAILGQGRTRALAESSDERKARIAVAQAMGRMESGFRASGLIPPDFDDLVRQAVNSVYGDKLRDIVRTQTRQRSRDDLGRFTTASAPPTHRNGKGTQLSGMDAAYARSEAFDRSRGNDADTGW